MGGSVWSLERVRRSPWAMALAAMMLVLPVALPPVARAFTSAVAPPSTRPGLKVALGSRSSSRKASRMRESS